VLVLIDGVRVEDVSSPSGGYDFGNLLTGGIDRIDVLRGSNSVVWGSAAIGGVIAVTTKEVNGAEASVEYGAKETVSADAVAGVANDRYAFSLNGGYARTDGVSAAAVGTEPDGYRQWRIGGRGRVNLTPISRSTPSRAMPTASSISTVIRRRLHRVRDTPNTRRPASSPAAPGSTTPAARTLDGGYALADTRRNYYDPTYGADPQYGYKGRSQRVDLTGRIALPAHFALDFGGTANGRASPPASTRSTARACPAATRCSAGTPTRRALPPGCASTITAASARRRRSAPTAASAWRRAAPARQLWRRVQGAHALPALFGLREPGLSPERSRSYDAGVEYTTADGVFHASATWFRRDTRNLIAYVSCFSVTSPLCADGRFGFYDNVGKTRAEGVELELRADVSPTFRAQAVYTYDRARNLTVADANYGKALARRPRNALTLSADWTSPLAGLTLGADVRLVSDSFDDAGNRTRLDGYG
jgi:vitamin B12 transporter